MKKGVKDYEPFDHTADAGLTVRGATLSEFFENAARGLTSLLVGTPPSPPHSIQEVFHLESNDKETLLVDWLSELLYRQSVHGLVFGSFRVTVTSGESTALDAVMGGEEMDPSFQFSREIKAVTYHGLKIEKAAQGWTARILFDV